MRYAVRQAERIDAIPAIKHHIGKIGAAQKHAEHRPLAAAVERDQLALDHMIVDMAASDQLDHALERLDRIAGGAEVERDQIGLAVGQHRDGRSEEPTSELQSLMRISYAVFCFEKKTL